MIIDALDSGGSGFGVGEPTFIAGPVVLADGKLAKVGLIQKTGLREGGAGQSQKSCCEKSQFHSAGSWEWLAGRRGGSDIAGGFWVGQRGVAIDGVDGQGVELQKKFLGADGSIFVAVEIGKESRSEAG